MNVLVAIVMVVFMLQVLTLAALAYLLYLLRKIEDTQDVIFNASANCEELLKAPHGDGFSFSAN